MSHKALNILFILCCINVVVVLAIVVGKYLLPFDPINILTGERRIFLSMENETKIVFPHFYFVHTLLIYLLALLGGVILVQKVFKLLQPPIRRFLLLAWEKRVKFGFFFLYFFLATFLVAIVLGTEYHLRKQGYFPGSFYQWNDFSLENPVITKEVIADETGMTFYAHDSFPRAGYPRMFVVNKQGFPTPFDFDRHTIDSLSGSGQNKKKKRLVLGDSFVEGLGASGFDSCFMEIYRRRNPDQVICCAALRGSDPVQYQQFATKLIPVISPDEVDVMFCGSNDVMPVDRKPVPYIPLFTDIKGVGCVFNYLAPDIAGGDTMALPPDQAYRAYRKKYSIQGNKDLWSVLCRQSCITTRIYSLLKRDAVKTKMLPPDSGITYRHIKRIKELADSAGAKFSIVFIPTPAMSEYGMKEYEQHFRWVFGDLWEYVHFCPKGMITQKDCVSESNCHFVDAGQIKFASFLQGEWAK